ncbi:MAG: phosphatase PAP2 family protein [Bacteroidia bacterium]|nr:phosphatase PAP2 family protein [Bacteroidia bacterium]
MDFINTIKDFDTQLFLFFNSKHNGFFDVVMYWFSHKLFWVPLYLFLFFLAFKQVGKRVWLVALAAALLILLSDQISVHAFKNIFLRLRPCHNLLIQAKVHLLNGHCGGAYGFVSSHAANTFALAMFLSLFFRGRINYFGSLIFLWASLVAYSRIYSGVHYPADVAVGAIVGMGIGVAVFKMYVFVQNKIYKTE